MSATKAKSSGGTNTQNSKNKSVDQHQANSKLSNQQQKSRTDNTNIGQPDSLYPMRASKISNDKMKENDLSDLLQQSTSIQSKANTLQFSETVESALNQLVPPTGEFDTPNFNGIEFINSRFPTDASLDELDEYTTQLQKKVLLINEEILTAVRKQASVGAQATKDLHEAKAAIKALFDKIQSIKQKAEKSESLVLELTRDIKSLDYGKQNLTSTLDAIRKLRKIEAGLKQLDSLTDKKRYNELGLVVKELTKLISHFEKYSELQKIKQINETFNQRTSILKTQMQQFFKNFENTTPETIKDACLLVEALGEEFRQKIVQQFVTQLLNLYRMMFRKGKKESRLENVHQRYNWIRKQIDKFLQEYGKIFPKYWDIPQEMVVEFCLQTRTDILEILNEEKDILEATTLNRSLLSTIRFEREMHSRYHVVTARELEKRLSQERELDPLKNLSSIEQRNLMKTPEGIKQRYRYLLQQRKLEQQAMEAASREIEEETKRISKKSYNFLGFISKVYEEFMGTYIDYEDKTMGETVKKILREETWSLDDNVDSSKDLFIYINSSMENCITFSKGKTLFSLSEIWKKHLNSYANALLNKLKSLAPPETKVESTFKFNEIVSILMRPENQNENVQCLSQKAVGSVCYMIKIADYCQTNVGAMERELRNIVEDEFKDKIQFKAIQELFFQAVQSALQVLVINIMNNVKPAFIKMTKMPWATYEHVGDASPYAAEIEKKINTLFPSLVDMVPKSYYITLCDKTVITFFTAYTSYIKKCKKISNAGAQQLLLDSTQLTNVFKRLVEFANQKYGVDDYEISRFTKLLKRQATKPETCLKVILSPTEALVETYTSLVKSPSLVEIQQIMDLKGLSKSEQSQLLKKMQQGGTNKGKNH